MARIGTLQTRGPRQTRGPLELIPPVAPWVPEDLDPIFPQPGPLHLEIGPGKGDWIRSFARAHPEARCMAIEIKRARAVWIEEKVLREGIENIRMICADAIKHLPTLFRPHTLDGIYVNFFDPWPRKRHLRRRFSQVRSVLAVAQLLKLGADFHFVTDHAARFEEAYEDFSQHPHLEDTWGFANRYERLPEYPVSIHEKKFRAQGRRIHFMRFRRIDPGS